MPYTHVIPLFMNLVLTIPSPNHAPTDTTEPPFTGKQTLSCYTLHTPTIVYILEKEKLHVCIKINR